jgi:hypothetical protein
VTKLGHVPVSAPMEAVAQHKQRDILL